MKKEIKMNVLEITEAQAEKLTDEELIGLDGELDVMRDEINENWDYSRGFDEYQEAFRDIDHASSIISCEQRHRQKPTMEPHSDYGDLMTIKEFIGACKAGGFIDSDGFGNYATKDEESDISIYPSDVMKGKIREDFTHVHWYNK